MKTSRVRPTHRRRWKGKTEEGVAKANERRALVTQEDRSNVETRGDVSESLEGQVNLERTTGFGPASAPASAGRGERVGKALETPSLPEPLKRTGPDKPAAISVD